MTVCIKGAIRNYLCSALLAAWTAVAGAADFTGPVIGEPYRVGSAFFILVEIPRPHDHTHETGGENTSALTCQTGKENPSCLLPLLDNMTHGDPDITYAYAYPIHRS